MKVSAALMSLALLDVGTPVGVPVYEEPYHQLRLTNAHARVMDISIPAGKSTLYHTHAADLVGVSIHDSPTRTVVVGGATTDAQPDPDGLIWYETFGANPVTHEVSNVGTRPTRYIAAEVLAGAAEPAKTAPADTANHRLELEKEKIFGFRVRLGGGEALTPHVHSGPVLLIGVSGGMVRLAGEGGGERTWQHAPGDFLWVEHGGPGAITNIGGAPFEAVELEWR
jgi:hypothetical protein